ncbi:hypothetical protein DIPPA_34659 [Diplonema papillatum]|nr:hypothetical protein DIPPA_34659 [Diplonema papillatum]
MPVKDTCDAALLTATSVNACVTLSEAFECPRCRYAEHREEHPAQEAPFRSETDGDCVDPRLKPGCDLRHDDVRRLCPCSPAKTSRFHGTAHRSLSSTPALRVQGRTELSVFMDGRSVMVVSQT